MSAQLLAIPQFFQRNFKNIWDHTVQQEVSKVANRVTVDTFEGKEQIYQNIDQLSFVPRQGRLGKTNPQQTTGGFRKMIKAQFKCAIIFDKWDQKFLDKLGRPDSEAVTEMRFAWQRAMDDGVIAAAPAAALGGVDPYITPIPFPSSQQIAVDFVKVGSQVNTGMTPDKLMRLVSVYETNNIDIGMEEAWLFMGPTQKEDLIQVVKTAPNAPYANMIGDWYNDTENKKLFGFRTSISTRLPVVSGVTNCLSWIKRGIFAAPDMMEIKMDVLPEREHALQIVAYADYGFMRRYEERVAGIYCDQTL